MKDITSTSFGLVIAFFLPGLVGLYSLSFWSTDMREIFQTFLTVESNIGLFLLIVLMALAIGLMVAAFRWVLFECIICKSIRLIPSDFKALNTEPKLAAFRAAVDENYRYHQFWGGMTIVTMPLYWGWLKSSWSILNIVNIFLAFVIFSAIEALNIGAAIAAYQNYVVRAKYILEGKEVEMPNGWKGRGTKKPAKKKTAKKKTAEKKTTKKKKKR